MGNHRIARISPHTDVEAIADWAMYREPVVSESIASIGYDDDAEVLDIEFVTGAVYRYRGVPEDVYEDFRQAPSKGAHFNRHIKDAYPFELVE